MNFRLPGPAQASEGNNAVGAYGNTPVTGIAVRPDMVHAHDQNPVGTHRYRDPYANGKGVLAYALTVGVRIVLVGYF